MESVGIQRPPVSALFGPLNGKIRERSIDTAAPDGTAHYKMMATPGLIATLAGCGLKSAAEV